MRVLTRNKLKSLSRNILPDNEDIIQNFENIDDVKSSGFVRAILISFIKDLDNWTDEELQKYLLERNIFCDEELLAYSAELMYKEV